MKQQYATIGKGVRFEFMHMFLRNVFLAYFIYQIAHFLYVISFCLYKYHRWYLSPYLFHYACVFMANAAVVRALPHSYNIIETYDRKLMQVFTAFDLN